MLRLVLKLSEEDRDWRQKHMLLLDNASYHMQNFNLAVFRQLNIPVLFLGPYAYEMAPIERVFGMLKTKDLNDRGTNVYNR